MRILISPIGKQDPVGKSLLLSGQTFGSALSICKMVQPDRAILLPTEAVDGDDTCTHAQDTKAWMDSECGVEAEVRPVFMEAANDYAEAIRAYGTAIRAIATEFPGATFLLNASSGTPAIKLACLLAVAEGVIKATPYYADDPTQTRRAEADRIYPLEVHFLRESALVQRTQALLKQGQFLLAQEPLEALSQEPFRLERRAQAAFWLRLCHLLAKWDEREYTVARGQLRKLQRDWTPASSPPTAYLMEMEVCLDRLWITDRPLGTMAWDLYFHARRLQSQGHLTSAVEQFWIAIENVTAERLEAGYGIASQELKNDVPELVQQDGDVERLMQSTGKSGSFLARFGYLRGRRNGCVHEGKVASLSLVQETDDLTRRWINVVGCPEPPTYPLSPETLQALALLFH